MKALKWAFISLLSIIAFFYFTCPVYDFPEPQPFSGGDIYNPYRKIDASDIKKANFQIQSYSWFGLTDGRRNKNVEIFQRYKSLNYDVIAISDYMKINRYYQELPGYIPVYEHGYSIFKHHQVVIGATQVNLRDYPVFQTIHHKQHVINVLNSNGALVFLAHPKLRSAYKPDDMRYLTGYDGIEVLNNMRFSVEYWDAALSAGRYVTILSNDDAHDIDNPVEVGHRCTYIISGDISGDSIIQALRTGNSYGADIYRPPGETFKMKELKAKSIPELTGVSLSNDTMTVKVNEKALEFRFIGQQGKIIDRVMNSDHASYVFKRSDTYVRTEIFFSDKTILMLNPLIRYDGQDIGVSEEASVNWLKTSMFWTFSWSIIIIVIFYYLRKNFKLKKVHGTS